MLNNVYDGNMKLISARGGTIFNKRVFPILWFGLIGFFVLMVYFDNRGAFPMEALFPLVFMAIIGFVVMKMLIFDLVDEVWDRGDILIIKNKNEEDIVPLTNIMNISYTVFTNPPRVTLMLRQPGKFGKQVTFMPPTRWFNFTLHPVITELIERVDSVRQK